MMLIEPMSNGGHNLRVILLISFEKLQRVRDNHKAIAHGFGGRGVDPEDSGVFQRIAIGVFDSNLRLAYSPQAAKDAGRRKACLVFLDEDLVWPEQKLFATRKARITLIRDRPVQGEVHQAR